MSSIAADTCNIPLNRLKTERSLIGRRAFQKGVAQGGLLWDYFMKGAEIEDPELAAQLRKARAQRYATNAAVVLVGFAAVFQASLGLQESNRRARHMVRPSICRAIRSRETIEA